MGSRRARGAALAGGTGGLGTVVLPVSRRDRFQHRRSAAAGCRRGDSTGARHGRRERAHGSAPPGGEHPARGGAAIQGWVGARSASTAGTGTQELSRPSRALPFEPFGPVADDVEETLLDLID